MKFAVFTVSTPAYTPEDIAPKLHELGYDGIEWRVVDEPPNPKGMDFWHGNKSTIPFTGFQDQIPRIRKLADDNQLEMPNLGTYVRSNDSIENIQSAIDGAKALGVKQLRINIPTYESSQPFMPLWNSSREDYKRIADMASKAGVKALIELHMRTICPSASSARAFLDELDPNHVGVIHDAGNMVYEGFENYRMGLELLGDYLAHVHVKNTGWIPKKYNEDKSVVWEAVARPVHKGVADLRALMAALVTVGYDDWIAFEDFSSENKIDQRLETNLAYTKRYYEEAVAAASNTEAKPDGA